MPYMCLKCGKEYWYVVTKFRCFECNGKQFRKMTTEEIRNSKYGHMLEKDIKMREDKNAKSNTNK